MGKKLSPEHIRKISEYRKGKSSPFKGKHHKLKYPSKWQSMFRENHPRWIKDRSKLKVNPKKHLDSSYKYWMLEVKKRDKWKCRIINSDCKGRLESHHILNWIEYPELRYDINNGITLCAFHHPRGREKEKRMVSTFMELLSVSKE